MMFDLFRTSGLLLAFSIMVSMPAAAQEGNTGIAFAYAPEQGSGICSGEDPANTIECARQKCIADGGGADECVPVAWCYPAGWSVGVGVMHKEGIHWSEYSCGWPTREAALAAGAVLCDTQFREFIDQCFVGQLWDEKGQPVSLEGGM